MLTALILEYQNATGMGLCAPYVSNLLTYVS
jgi:hypothetical protein